MVRVKLLKKIGRLSQGTIGTISDSTYANYGIGDNVIFPHNVSFFVNSDEWSVGNNLLELAQPPTAKQPETRRPKRQLALI
jgi:hypothetical protein